MRHVVATIDQIPPGERMLVSALEPNEFATFRRCLDKLDRRLESHIRIHDWQRFLK